MQSYTAPIKGKKIGLIILIELIPHKIVTKVLTKKLPQTETNLIDINWKVELIQWNVVLSFCWGQKENGKQHHFGNIFSPSLSNKIGILYIQRLT